MNQLFPKASVGGVADLTVGFVGSQSPHFAERGVPLLRGQNIREFALDMKNVKFISDDTHRKWRKSSLGAGDVVLVRVGYPGTACVIPAGLGDLNAASLVIVRPDATKLDPHYFCNLMNSPWGKSAIAGRLVGSAQQVLNVGAVAQMEIPLPPIEVQRRLAEILSAYDELIENNTRRIKILEETAQSIYKEWFVNFCYPGHENVPLVDSELGPIPEGWSVEPIGDVVDTFGGGTPSRSVDEYWAEGSIPWFTPTDLTRSKSMFMSDTAARISDLGLAKSSAKLVPARSVLMTSRATIGVTAITSMAAATNQGFITCVPNQRLSEYHLYWWLAEMNERISQIASGATFKEISRGRFRQLPIAVPPADIESLFRDQVHEFGQLIGNLLLTNLNLRETRDLLLPRLVSGEIDVSALDMPGESQQSAGVADGILRLAIDTCVVIAAINEGEPHHRSCRTLFDLADAGVVELLVSSTFEYDQEKGWEKDPKRASRNAEWLASQRVSRIAGPFTVGVTRLGSDVLVSEGQGELFERLDNEFGPMTRGAEVFDRRKAFDVHHYKAAIMASADVFVTTDEKDVLGRLRQVVEGLVPLPVVSPEEAVDMVTQSAS